MTAATLRVDVAILGGGIAGLWLLARLRRAGYSALLLERHAMGAGQTLASQGIIHGGLKYALDMKLNSASDALADMPRRWRACLAGNGEPDLRGTAIASERHLFWSRRTLASRVAGFFGSKLVRGRAQALESSEWPAVLQDPAHVGAVYALDEIVLDVPDLLRALARPHHEFIRKTEGEVRISDAGDEVVISVSDAGGQDRQIRAAHLVATAGSGNEAVLAQCGLPVGAAQRRPLQMAMIAHAPGPLWAHCFDVSDKPRVTITTHRRKDGTLVWYVGGQIAENGVGQNTDTFLAAVRAEMAELLPALDFSRSQFAAFPVDRAEGATESGAKPDGPVLRQAGRVWIAWPTKLALAPQLADLVLMRLPPPANPAFDPAALAGWPAPDIADPPWEAATWR